MNPRTTQIVRSPVVRDLSGTRLRNSSMRPLIKALFQTVTGSIPFLKLDTKCRYCGTRPNVRISPKTRERYEARDVDDDETVMT